MTKRHLQLLLLNLSANLLLAALLLFGIFSAMQRQLEREQRRILEGLALSLASKIDLWILEPIAQRHLVPNEAFLLQRMEEMPTDGIRLLERLEKAQVESVDLYLPSGERSIKRVNLFGNTLWGSEAGAFNKTTSTEQIRIAIHAPDKKALAWVEISARKKLLGAKQILRQDLWVWLAIFIFIFSFGNSLLLALYYRSSQRQVRRVERSLEKAKESREEYRHLIQNSPDILFSLDWDLKVKTVNRSVTEHLSLPPKRLIGRSLIDIIFFSKDSFHRLNRDIFLEKIELLKQGRRRKVQFKVYFQLESTGEMRPYLLELSLGRRRKHGSMVIYGRAQRESSGSLLGAFCKGRQSYSISNSLIEAEELSQIATTNLRRYMKQEEVEHLRVAVRELILNAIEHGNLAISYEEKTSALKEGRYLDLFRQRREDPRFSQRRVQVDFLLDRRRFWIHLRDEGAGFDYKNFLEKKLPSLKASQESHGRGLMLAVSGFHEIRFRGRGNEVFATFYMQKAKPSDKGGQVPGFES